ncbi:glycosyl hydrolase [Luteimicrobium subarcticum]|uniref:Glycosyl hydrolase family 26 n=1 Tax=Luteimicrobium subarcticum TaxID=620910 RepID=A0A2M8WRV8_9MICO|nr:glycosyl hydrolase [Luteimicrobium subarcticum]PJI93576.1 glycosyl hydrolase family 26 [Luteimicrobium subarcticum]
MKRLFTLSVTTAAALAALGGTTAPAGAAPGAVPAADASTGVSADAGTGYQRVLDDFDGYADDAALTAAYSRNPNGGDVALHRADSLDPASSGHAMRLDYTYRSGYAGVSRPVADGYWPGLRSVDLWVQDLTPGQDVLLQLSDGASYEAHLSRVAGFDATSTAPQHLTIPVADFAPKSGSGTLDPKGVTTFAVYANQQNGVASGSVVLDDVRLTFDREPVTPTVTFPRTRLTADGVSNLVTVLNDEAAKPAGSRIVQATWTSTDESVLASRPDRLAPKGDFERDGRASVHLTSLTLFADGTTFTVRPDVTLDVRVRHLPPPVGVVDYLRSLTGNGMLSAMHHDQSYADPAATDVLHQRVAREFGVYPALYSADFLTGGTVAYRQNMIDEVKRQWANGNLVQIMFHVSPPQYTVAQEAQGGWGGDTGPETMPSPNHVYSYLYQDQFDQLLTDGTPIHENWEQRMDEYARYLQQLEDAGVTVMLRPFHEMNQHVFWWGGRPDDPSTPQVEGSPALYRMFHDYLVKTKGLTNIVWVWDVQDLPDDYGYADGDAKFDRYEGVPGGLAEYDANDWRSFDPGKDYYDVLAVDYYDLDKYQQKYYDQASAIATEDGGKPMIIGETFYLPTAEQEAAAPKYTLAMPWGARTWNAENTGPAGMADFYSRSIGASGTPRFATLDTTLRATTAPSVRGTARVGARLTGDPGRWSLDDTTFTYRWTVGGRTVSGATSSTYVPRLRDIGQRIAVVVTAHRAGASDGTATSAATRGVTLFGVLHRGAPRR